MMLMEVLKGDRRQEQTYNELQAYRRLSSFSLSLSLKTADF
jgi:hypothetical protein